MPISDDASIRPTHTGEIPSSTGSGTSTTLSTPRSNPSRPSPPAVASVSRRESPCRQTPSCSSWPARPAHDNTDDHLAPSSTAQSRVAATLPDKRRHVRSAFTHEEQANALLTPMGH
jgi:hypothetical protein